MGQSMLGNGEIETPWGPLQKVNTKTSSSRIQEVPGRQGEASVPLTPTDTVPGTIRSSELPSLMSDKSSLSGLFCCSSQASKYRSQTKPLRPSRQSMAEDRASKPKWARTIEEVHYQTPQTGERSPRDSKVASGSPGKLEGVLTTPMIEVSALSEVVVNSSDDWVLKVTEPSGNSKTVRFSIDSPRAPRLSGRTKLFGKGCTAQYPCKPDAPGRAYELFIFVGLTLLGLFLAGTMNLETFSQTANQGSVKTFGAPKVSRSDKSKDSEACATCKRAWVPSNLAREPAETYPEVSETRKWIPIRDRPQYDFWYNICPFV